MIEALVDSEVELINGGNRNLPAEPGINFWDKWVMPIIKPSLVVEST
jgi:hypothetical protein